MGKLWYIIIIGIFAMLGCSLVLPVFNKKSGYDLLVKSFDKSIDSTVSSLNDWVIDNNTVYVDNSQVFASATPHTINGDGDVVFEFSSKVYSGNVDFCWGFNQQVMKPTNIWIWKNYTHENFTLGFEEDWGCITLYNVTDYENLGIENYDDYSVCLGTRNNSFLFNVSYQIFDEMEDLWVNTSCVYAFSSYNVDGDDYIICGNYNKSVKIWDNQTYWDWKPWNVQYNHIKYNYQNMTDWYITSSINIEQSILYKCKIHIKQLKIQLGDINSKYWFAFKPSSETLSQAITNGHLYYLDPWYDSNWQYRKEITVSSKIEGYQTMLNISKGADTTFNCSNHCNTNFSDIRFTNSSGDGLIPYWIESYIENGADSYAHIWINNLYNESTLYMYYGNSGASDSSSGSDTFIFYEDFNSISEWNHNTDTHFSLSDGIMTAVQDANWGYIYYDLGSSMQTKIKARVLADVMTNNGMISITNCLNTLSVWDWNPTSSIEMDFYDRLIDASTACLRIANKDDSATSGELVVLRVEEGLDDDVWYRALMCYPLDGYVYNDTTNALMESGNDSPGTFTNPRYIYIQTRNYATTGYTVKFDWLFVGKHTSGTEPVFVFDSEEIASNPVYKPVINFAGSLSSMGGPEKLPLTFVDAPNGYYTSNSQQIKDYILMNVSCANATSVKLNYTINGGSSWINGSESFESSGGDYWELNLSGITTTGNGFSFDVYAYNDDSNNVTAWQKKDKHNNTIRRWVKLDQTPSSDILDMNLLYFYHDDYTVFDVDPASWMSDLQWFDQGIGTDNDSGILVDTVPTDSIEYLECNEMVWGWWNKSVCMDSDTLVSVTYHLWIDDEIGSDENAKLRIGKDRDGSPDYTLMDYDEPWLNFTDAITNITDDLMSGYTYNLFHGTLYLNTPYSNLTTNNIYELAVMVFAGDGLGIHLFDNRSASSWVIFNIYDNATLQGMDSDSDGLNDYQEIWITKTNPELADTDNDGVSDLNECIAHSDPNDFTDTDSPSWNDLLMNGDFSFTDTLVETNLIMNNDFSFSDNLEQQNLLLNNDFTFTDTLSQQNLLMNNDFTFSDLLQWNNLLMDNDFTFKDELVETNLLMNNDFSFKDILSETNLLMNNDFTFSDTLNQNNLIMNQDFTFKDITFTELITNQDFSFSDALSQQNLLLNNDFTFSDTLSETNLIMNNDFSFSDTLSETNLIMNNDFTFSDIVEWQDLLMNNDFSFSHILDETNLIMNNDFSFSDTLSETNLIMNQDFTFSDIINWNNLIMNQNFLFYATSANLTISNVYPGNNSYSIPLQPYLYATFNSSTGKTMNVSWYYGLTQGNENILIETDTNITNSTQSSLFFIASSSVTAYYWRIWLNDGTSNINETFVFTTEGVNGIGISPRSNIGTLSVLGIFGVLGIIFIIIRRRREYGEDE